MSSVLEPGVIELRAPEPGDGLVELRVVELRVEPGQAIDEDDVLYEVESDKATVEVPSPHAGTLVRWLVEEDAVVEAGSPVALLALRQALPAPAPREGRAAIPPRTRAYARSKGLGPDELRRVPAAGPRLSPADVDRHLARSAPRPDPAGVLPLSAAQQRLARRMRRQRELSIPSALFALTDLDGLLEGARHLLEGDADAPDVSLTQAVAFCVARAVRAHPLLRSTLQSPTTRREHPHLELGLAVHLPGGDLAVAVVERADRLGLADFLRQAQAAIARALDGEDQASERTQVVLSHLGEVGILGGVPVLTWPTVAVLAMGCPFPGRPHQVQLNLSFEHALLNGMEAARFLQTVQRCIRELAAGREPDPTPAGAPPAAARGSVHDPGAVLDRQLRELAPGVERRDDAPWSTLGMDSLKLVSLCRALSEDLGVPVDLRDAWQAPTPARLRELLARRLFGLPSTTARPSLAADCWEPSPHAERFVCRGLGPASGRTLRSLRDLHRHEPGAFDTAFAQATALLAREVETALLDPFDGLRAALIGPPMGAFAQDLLVVSDDGGALAGVVVASLDRTRSGLPFVVVDNIARTRDTDLPFAAIIAAWLAWLEARAPATVTVLTEVEWPDPAAPDPQVEVLWSISRDHMGLKLAVQRAPRGERVRVPYLQPPTTAGPALPMALLVGTEASSLDKQAFLDLVRALYDQYEAIDGVVPPGHTRALLARLEADLAHGPRIELVDLHEARAQLPQPGPTPEAP